MNTLQKLYDRRAKAFAEAEDYRRRSADGLSAEDETAWRTALDEIERLDSQIDAHGQGVDGSTDMRTASPRRSDSAPVEIPRSHLLTRSDSYADWSRRNAPQRGRPEDGAPLDLGRYLRGIVTGDWTDAENERRAMGEGVLAGGGYMVPTTLANEVIDLARNQTRVIQAGAVTVPMPTQKHTVAKWTADPTPAWRAEHEVINPTDGGLDAVELVAKSLASLTKVSVELVEDSSPSISDQLRRALAATFAVSIDYAALYGTGTGDEPTGVKASTETHKTDLGANGAAVDWDTLLDGVGWLEDNNETPSAIIYSPRTDRELAKLRESSTGQYLAPPVKLASLPRLATNQVPNNLTKGTATNASDLFVADWSQLYVGIRSDVRLTVLTERYADTLEVGFLMHFRGDVAVARGDAFNVMTGAIPPAA